MSRPDDEVDCREILLRGLLARHVRRRGASDPVCSPDAFALRSATDRRAKETQLSVNRESLIESYEALSAKLSASVAFASLHTGRVRQLGLSVTADPTPQGSCSRRHRRTGAPGRWA